MYFKSLRFFSSFKLILSVCWSQIHISFFYLFDTNLRLTFPVGSFNYSSVLDFPILFLACLLVFQSWRSHRHGFNLNLLKMFLRLSVIVKKCNSEIVILEFRIFFFIILWKNFTPEEGVGRFLPPPYLTRGNAFVSVSTLTIQRLEKEGGGFRFLVPVSKLD